MGKYDELEEHVKISEGNKTPLVLIKLCNEIAESNRLKRLELQLFLASKNISSEKYEELSMPFREDKA